MEIVSNIHYVGVNDRTKTLFESLWPLPNGVSYNSYLIDDERVTLIDTVDSNFFELFLKKIQSIIGDRPIDYLIINHMEPDHSGSINLIKKFYPNITIVGNKKTFEMIEGFYGPVGEKVVVAENNTLELGKRTLKFFMIPMVHWPETMATYDIDDAVIFSGDAFGCFGALNGGVIDSKIDTSIYWDEMVRYYSNIVGKYGSPVQKALDKLKELKINAICSTHGPVWTTERCKVIDIYDRMSRYDSEKGVVVAYGSMYGNTAEMAELIAQELNELGIKKVVVHDVSRTPHSYIIADVFRYKGIIVGAPTYNNQMFPDMEALLSKLAARDIKNRVLGFFGSHSWASAAVKRIEEFNTKLKFEVISAPVDMKHSMKPDVAQHCKELARAMVERLDADLKK
ncbi:FprA family A-type flavoprotein [Phocaeicola paurosaccharolyticus]|uniref:FprA family A-type flavoprotein n=1 Tax=Phocaeicola paurosaccharolyticus TaxID=732242 RepID=UPI0004680FA1|nr:FprA family A-type flavoprotein [Phocaeicola paurosaccharolyticus]